MILPEKLNKLKYKHYKRVLYHQILKAIAEYPSLIFFLSTFSFADWLSAVFSYVRDG